jgi:hypothetical protein
VDPVPDKTITTFRHFHIPRRNDLGGITARIEVDREENTASFHVSFCMVDPRGDRRKKITKDPKAKCTDQFSRKEGRNTIMEQISKKVPPVKIALNRNVPLLDNVLAELFHNKTIKTPSWFRRSKTRRAYVAERLQNRIGEIDKKVPVEDAMGKITSFLAAYGMDKLAIGEIMSRM